MSSTPVELKHGTHAAYGRGCRCPACRAGHAEVQRAWANRKAAAKAAHRAAGGGTSGTTALVCECGGLLAETDAGRVFCLRCEPEVA